jgi:hypothetical protein
MHRTSTTLIVAIGMLAIAPAVTLAGPVYYNTFNDSVTGLNQWTDFSDSNKQRWTISAGADSYPNDVYERPTVQEYNVYNNTSGGVIFAAKEYFQYLDIVLAKAGFDDSYLYIAIEMYGLNKHTENNVQTHVGLVERYGFRIATESTAMLLYVDNPANKLNPTQFNGNKAEGYRDTNGDVGGAGGIGVPNEGGGNGYENKIIADGKYNGQLVLQSRIDPNSAKTVEFMLDYRAFGLTSDDLLGLKYLGFEAIKGGPKDPQNYLWNDKYSPSQAGSPYRATSGDLSKSIYGTQGLGNIYELDTLRGGPITPPIVYAPPTDPPAVVPLPPAAWSGLASLAGIGIVNLRKRLRGR